MPKHEDDQIEKLLALIDKKQKIKNQTISIRNLYVYSALGRDFSYGEANTTSANSPPLKRLMTHIRLLAKITHAYHEAYYCERKDWKFVVKKNCQNKITRLLLHEFSLYTRRPLTMNKFNGLQDKIHKMAKELHENVHLLLSSFAVLAEDQKTVLNVCLYVTCGENAAIERFSKARFSKKDIQYLGAISFGQYTNNSLVKSFISIPPKKPNSPSFIVSNRSVFTITLRSGAEYTQCVDVCLDNAHKHAETLIIAAAKTNADNNFYFIPPQVNHIVTSNHIKVSSSPSTQTTHIDCSRGNFKHIDDDILLLDVLKKIVRENSMITGIFISRSAQGLLINSPFGQRYSIVVGEEEALGEFSDSLKPLINYNNQLFKAQMIKIHIPSPVNIYIANLLTRLISIGIIPSTLDLLYFYIINKIPSDIAFSELQKRYHQLKLAPISSMQNILNVSPGFFDRVMSYIQLSKNTLLLNEICENLSYFSKKSSIIALRLVFTNPADFTPSSIIFILKNINSAYFDNLGEIELLLFKYFNFKYLKENIIFTKNISFSPDQHDIKLTTAFTSKWLAIINVTLQELITPDLQNCCLLICEKFNPFINRPPENSSIITEKNCPIYSQNAKIYMPLKRKQLSAFSFYLSSKIASNKIVPKKLLTIEYSRFQLTDINNALPFFAYKNPESAQLNIDLCILSDQYYQLFNPVHKKIKLIFKLINYINTFDNETKLGFLWILEKDLTFIRSFKEISSAFLQETIEKTPLIDHADQNFISFVMGKFCYFKKYLIEKLSKHQIDDPNKEFIDFLKEWDLSAFSSNPINDAMRPVAAYQASRNTT